MRPSTASTSAVKSAQEMVGRKLFVTYSPNCRQFPSQGTHHLDVEDLQDALKCVEHQGMTMLLEGPKANKSQASGEQGIVCSEQ